MGMFTVLFWLLVLAFLARWVFSSPQHALPEQTRRTEAELARLREDVERLTAQVDRLQDEQSFMVRLLSEGRSAPPPLGAGESGPSIAGGDIVPGPADEPEERTG